MQLTFDLRRLLVVANHWGPVYHLCYDDSSTAWYGEAPSPFPSIEAAVAWAEAHGRTPEVSEDTQLAWAHWTPEEVAKYHAQCQQ